MKKVYSCLTLVSSLLFVLSFSARAQTYTFTCPTTTTTWTVPPGVTSITVDVQGAAGGQEGPGGATTPGKGGRVQATATVVPGTVLNIFIGGVGAHGGAGGALGGFNGGGNAANYFYPPFATNYSGGGGGGASDIRIGGVGLANRVIVGGGGGGAGSDGTCSFSGDQPGGDGGGLVGANGVTCDAILIADGLSPVVDAGGGTQVSGGVGGVLYTYTSGSPGTLGVGGNSNGGGVGGGPAGGGGGGYYGGGGGCWMGGGGGSSYADPTATGVVYTSGYNSGCGFVSITVNCVAGTITGTGTVCVGGTTALTDATTGGTWSSTAGGVATVSATGVVTGVSAGTATISYTMPAGCAATSVVTVTANPAISGLSYICVGSSTTLTDPLGAGTWTSSASGIASIGSSTGVLAALAVGTTNITYTSASGCTATSVVTVAPSPSAISGSTTVCVTGVITLSDTPAGGTWSSSSGNATVDAFGNVIGVALGTSVITYASSPSCFATTTISVFNAPTAIIGPPTVCQAGTTNLLDLVAGGTWSSSNPAIATVGSTGSLTLVSGVIPGAVTITYSMGGSCYVTTPMTVIAQPGPISGILTVCSGSTTNLTDAVAGGGWISGAPGTASVTGSGVVTGGATLGTAIITYTTGCAPDATAVVTVIGTPGVITGTATVCQALTTNLTDATPGGTWSTTPGTGTVTVGSTGLVTGVSAGTATVSYSTGCATPMTIVVTVNPSPTPITGNVPVCVGLTATLNSTPAGGTWTTTAGTGSVGIGASTGIITGSTAGTATVTYSFGGSCYALATVTVNTVPTAITGNVPVCVGLTATLNSTPAGGTWTTTAGTGSVGIGAATGIITGSTAGNATVTYSLGAGCSISATVTVNSNPTAITGNVPVCVGLTTTLNSTPAGGTWTTTAGTGSVGIGAGTGIITGNTAGNATVTYTLGTGCIVTATVTVNSNPTAITGNVPVCVGLTTTLNSTPAGGTWSTTPGTGSVGIGAGTGIVTGNTAGNATVTYTLGTGCITTATVTVNGNPGVVTGNVPVCVGLTATLNSTPAGGTWTSTAGTGSVGIGAGTGIITGSTAGNATVTYTLGTGCIVTATVTVNPNPTTITGNVPVCIGLTTTLNSTPAGGTWTTTAGTGSVGIGAGTGIMTGGTAGNATVTYTLGTGCITTATVTVNSNPTVITGNTPVCVGLTATLNSTPAGGTWTTTAGTGSVGIGAATGIITGNTAGNATVTYSLGTGCIVTATVTVNPNPTAITGNVPVCVGLTTTLNSTPAGGTWTTTAGTGSVGIGAGTGIITGGTAGNATVTYTLGTSCIVTAAVTVNPNPTVITGNVPVCVGLTATLNSTPAGGTWSTTAGTGSVGIGAGTGIITGNTAGNANVTYTLGTGCVITAIVTVNSNPTTITGNVPVCVGLTTTLNSTPAGGTWTTTAGTGSVGIGAGTGVITGGTAGNATVTYTLGTGCIATATVTVNSNPTPITGPTAVCVGLTATLNSTPAGGTWTSSNGNTGVGAGTGVITGNSVGTSTITYALSTGCIATTTITVNSVPGVITGTLTVCVGAITALTDAGGGTWTSSTGNASVDAFGNVTGLFPGTSTITYALGSGCTSSAIVTVNVNPTVITGNVPVCVGLTATLNSTPAGGTWTTSAGTGSVGIGPGTGIITGNTAGNANVTYTLSTGCKVTDVATVNPNPTTITGNVPVCVGLATTLNSTPAGGAWSTSAGTGSVGINPATGVITGGTAGNAMVTYTIGTGCIITATVTVNNNPAAITGNVPVCVGLTATLNSTPAGGTWTTTAGTGSVGIGAGTGIITGGTAGNATVNYTLSTGCTVAATVTVNSNPTSITGNVPVCIGLTTTLNSTPAGGAWSTTAGTGSVVINPATGVMNGGTAGNATVTYTLGTGCITTATVTVNPLPTAITGNNPVCVGLTATLNATPAGGTWSTTSGTGSVGIGAGTGIITGGTAGNATVTYTLSTGCIVTATVTVNANPSTITGSTSVCVGSTTTLNATPAGGTWTSSNGNASAGAGTGIISGNIVGTSTITYSLSTGCITTTIVTVNTVPTPITGNLNVCVGLTTTLNSTPGGGTWSTTAGTGTVGIGAGTGIVTGGTVGNATVTYSLGAGCSVSATVTINGNPTAITGNTPVCIGLTATLNATPAGGTWSAAAGTGSVGIGLGSGIMTGGTAGTATVTYTVGTGCYVTAIATVNPNPTAITGNIPVCVGLTTTLNSTPAGGAWSTSAGTGSVGINPATGAMTGGTAGNATVTYTVGTGCVVTATVTVNSNPTTITGNVPVCVAATVTLNSTPAGGTWSSGAGTGTIGIGAGTGIVTGGTAGTAGVTYTLGTGCTNTTVVTINPLPAAIPGTLHVCLGSSVTLTDPTGGGVWTTSNGNATIAAGSITGVFAGTDVVTYTLPTTGCYITAVETINALPAGITGTQFVCSGLTTSLTDITPGGTWSSSATGTAAVSASGIVTGGATAGTAVITYTSALGCIATAIVTVNPLPSAITGNLAICIGLTTVLTDASAGGTWASSNGNASVVSGTVTGITGGTSIITYTLPTGCITTSIVTVNSLPVPIMGTLTVCSGLTTSLSDTPGGGTWSSSAIGTAAVGSSTGLVTGGLTAGTAIITYTIGTGCITTAVVTVNPLPTNILGTLTVCTGLTTALTDLTGAGTWSSGNPAAGSISASGVVTGISAGTTMITYKLATGCLITSVVTVNAQPSAITGTMTVCVGLTTALTDAGGGTWGSSALGVASVSGSGVVTGGPGTGTATITYALPTGCFVTATVTVNAFPSAGLITGTFTVCPSASTNLTDAAVGGVWTTSSITVASVDMFGVVNGIAPGTTTISYSVTNMCGTIATSVVVTVNPFPNAGVITGIDVVCPGNTSALTDAVPGGTWSSAAPSVASISSTGLLTGLSFGTATIIYETTSICGNAFATVVASVNPAPFAGTILGSLIVCPGTTITLSDPGSGGGGSWSSGSPSTATIGSSSGVVTGVDTGTAVITYSLTNSCATATTTTTVTVHPFPKAIMGLGVLCQANTVFLTDSVSGGAWSSSNVTIATVVPVAGVFATGAVSGVTVGTVNISYVVAPGCLVTKTMTVTPLGAISAGSQLCTGATETATDLPGGGTWISSTPSVATINSVGMITAIASGAAVISYELSPGCIVTTPVTVNGLPADFYMTGGGSYCFGSAGVHIGLDGADTGVIYQLFLGASVVATDTGNGLPIDFGVYSVTGVYNVLATSATSGCTNTMSGSATVTVTFPVPPTVSINTAPSTIVCVGSPATFTAIPTNGGPSPLYNWYVNGVSVGTGDTYTYTPSNGDAVVVKLTSDAACVFPDTAVALQIMTTTTGLTPSVSLSVSPGDSVCPGVPVTITPSPINGGTSPVYSWIKNGVFEGGGATYTFLPVGGDNVICWMQSNLSCSLLDSVHSDNNISMNVPAITVPLLSITATPGNRVVAGETVTLVTTATFSGLNLTYQWELNGNPISGATTNTYTSSSFVNLDSVTCLVTGYSVCGSATREVSITIYDTLALGISNMQSGADLRLTPNPNTGSFTIKGSLGSAQDEEVTLEVTDMLGQVVYKNKVIAREGRINESIQTGNTLANGMYMLNLRSGHDNIVFHFVIER